MTIRSSYLQGKETLMSSEIEKLTTKGLIERILEPNPNIKDTSSRQQARLTTVVSLIISSGEFRWGDYWLNCPISSQPDHRPVYPGNHNVNCLCLGAFRKFPGGQYCPGRRFDSGRIFYRCNIFRNNRHYHHPVDRNIPAFRPEHCPLPVADNHHHPVIVLITIGVLPLMASVSSGTELILFFGLALVEGVFVLIAWYRERTEILQQDEIGSLRGRLEERVEERTRYTRIAADIAQEIISSSSIEQLLGQAVDLTAARFGFADVGIYLAYETEHFLELKAAQGSRTGEAVKGRQTCKVRPPVFARLGGRKQTTKADNKNCRGFFASGTGTFCREPVRNLYSNPQW